MPVATSPSNRPDVPAGVTVGAVVSMHFALVLSHEDLAALRAAPERFEVLRPTPPTR
jgi:hypothetical protein